MDIIMPKPIKQEPSGPHIQDRFSCFLCPYKSKSPVATALHFRHHEEGTPLYDCRGTVPFYTCNNCSFKTNLIVKLRRHKCHVEDMNKTKLLRCDFCDFWTYSLLVLTKHVSGCKHKEKKAVNISITKGKQREYMKSYRFLAQLRYSTVNWVKCEKCSFLVRLKGNIGKHLSNYAWQESHKWFLCDLCLFNVKQIFELRQHVLREHGEDV